MIEVGQCFVLKFTGTLLLSLKLVFLLNHDMFMTVTPVPAQSNVYTRLLLVIFGRKYFFP